MKKYILALCLVLLPVVTFAEYKGKTFVIDCSRGGLNHDLNQDRVAPTMMVDGTENINIHQGGRSKRGGTDNVNSSAIGGTPRIYGIYEYRQKDGTSEILTADGNGEILSDYNDGAPIQTGLTINRAVHFETFNNLCYICTGNNQVQVYDGTTCANMTNPAVEWNGTGTNYPRKMVTHGRGEAARLWAIYGVEDPYTVFASAISTGDGTTEADFVTGVFSMPIDTADGHGIVNAVEFGDRLLCFSKHHVYTIDDTDSSIANWGYEKSQWEGGTANDRTVLLVANDIVSMTDDGNVYSVTTAQAYGDYKKTSITSANFIDVWVRSNLNLTAIDDFHMVYDPVLRAIYFFVVRSGKSAVDTALVYFIDRGPEEGWVVKNNEINDSGYSASCSVIVEKAVGDNEVYTGGWADGFVWELETTARNDNGAAYNSSFRTPRFHLGNPRTTKRFDAGWILTESVGDNDVVVDIWVDGILVGQEIVPLDGGGDVYGTGKYGTATYGGSSFVEATFPINKVGKRLEFLVYNNSADQDFLTTMIMVDFKDLGSQLK